MTGTSATAGEYLVTPNRVVSAANGIDYAYREVGEGPPLVLLQHFRGNLDNWDPALIDALASDRRVVTFDNAGAGGSTGATPSTMTQMAVDAIAFLDAIELVNVDILGFSIGSFVAQELALIRPALVRRLVLASSAPQGAAGMHGWAPEVIGAVGAPAPNPDGYLSVFFTRSTESRQSGMQTLGRLNARSDDRDEPTTLADPTGAIRRGMRLGNPGSRAAAAGQRHRRARVRRQRRQRPDDPAALLLSPRRADPASTGQDIPRLGTRLLVPAPRCLCRGCRDVPEHAEVTAAGNGASA